MVPCHIFKKLRKNFESQPFFYAHLTYTNDDVIRIVASNGSKKRYS